MALWPRQCTAKVATLSANLAAASLEAEACLAEAKELKQQLQALGVLQHDEGASEAALEDEETFKLKLMLSALTQKVCTGLHA